MLDTQKYLIANGLQKLQDDLKIIVRDYSDRICLNYDQIESEKGHPVCDECRALILRKDAHWSVMSQAYVRFLNIEEDKRTSEFPVTSPKTRIESKIDGSLLSLYWDEANNKWQPATRSCCFAEGPTVLGNTFEQVFYKAIQNTRVMEYLNSFSGNKNVTWIYELCSPENRIVTPYAEYKVFLTGARDKITGQECDGDTLDSVAKEMGVERPERFAFKSLPEAIEKANSLHCMQEGFVLVYEDGLSFWRMKCKNSKYLAISHLRGNGQISAYRVLTLVMLGEQAEYLSYFESDHPWFDFVESEYKCLESNLQEVWDNTKDIVDQKTFALSILDKIRYKIESGLLFSARKSGKSPLDLLYQSDPKKVALSMGLKEKMQQKFNVKLSDEDSGTL